MKWVPLVFGLFLESSVPRQIIPVTASSIYTLKLLSYSRRTFMSFEFKANDPEKFNKDFQLKLSFTIILFFPIELFSFQLNCWLNFRIQDHLFTYH